MIPNFCESALFFVFGSNLKGAHGKGAALEARQKWGAIYGVGVGKQGRSYGIPTKDRNIRTLPLSEIDKYVDYFLAYARYNVMDTFILTRVGCGLAGYKDSDIAPMFSDSTENVIFPEEWKSYAACYNYYWTKDSTGKFIFHRVGNDVKS